MSTKAYRPQRDDHVTDGSEVLEDYPHEISRTQLLPRIAARNKKAVRTVRQELYFYFKIRAGRQCSCYDLEVAPDTLCRCCWGTGIVGGYVKYGTELFTLDVTHPNIRSVNVIPDYTARQKPTPLTLIEGATFGYAQFTVPIQKNVLKNDAFLSITRAGEGTGIDAYLKSPAETLFVPFTQAAFEQRLSVESIEVRIEFSRVSADTKPPRFFCLHGRYRRRPDKDLILIANVPRTPRSQFLDDRGLIEQWEHQHFYLDNTLRSITNEDFISDVDNTTRWKIVTVNPFDPENQNLSWDLDTRLVQHYESYRYVPF